MTSVNFLKPNKDNLSLFLVAGVLFFTLGLVDFCLNNFYDKNITGFLPGFKIGRAHVRTPVTSLSRMPSSA